MGVPEAEWLHLAKGTPVGSKRRVRHLRERRVNMVVGNEPDRWFCYCQSCKEGQIVMKEHVRVTGVPAPKESESLALPLDLVNVLHADTATQAGVLGFLAHKNMDAVYLPPLYFSPSRKRLLIPSANGWLGRDTTERSMQKWLTFTVGTTFLGQTKPGLKQIAVVVEDPFSYYKVMWALRDFPEYTVFSSLGTSVSDALVMVLLSYQDVRFFYDGDKAGWKGAAVETSRFRAFGCKSQSMCAPNDMDPKDMTIEQIREHLK